MLHSSEISPIRCNNCEE